MPFSRPFKVQRDRKAASSSNAPNGELTWKLDESMNTGVEEAFAFKHLHRACGTCFAQAFALADVRRNSKPGRHQICTSGKALKAA